VCNSHKITVSSYVIIAIVAVAGFLEFQKYTQDQSARATSASYIQASDNAAAGNVDQSIKEFLAIADKAPAGYAGLSLVRAAALKLEAGESTEAVSLLEPISSPMKALILTLLIAPRRLWKKMRLMNFWHVSWWALRD